MQFKDDGEIAALIIGGFGFSVAILAITGMVFGHYGFYTSLGLISLALIGGVIHLNKHK
jgi:hypothetical protein